MQSDWSFLFLMLIQPFVIGALLFFLADGEMFNGPNGPTPGSQTILVALSVSAVYLGVLLAMRELVKERVIYRRERMVGLRLGPYLFSKVLVLSFFSFYQSFILITLVLLKAPVSSRRAGLWAPFEMLVTLFLTAFGGMALGLLLSALARTQEVLGALVPMVMIPQFVLNKVVMDISGFLDPVGRFMITTWSTEAMGDSVGLTNAIVTVPPDPLTGKTRSVLEYNPTLSDLLLHWLVLLALSVSFLALAWWRQKQRDKFKG